MRTQGCSGCTAPHQSYLIDRRGGNPRAVQLMLGHAEIESTVWYLGIEVDDAQVIFEKADF
jgi:site-specific recombinase XerD